jgi:hypothetical protein
MAKITEILYSDSEANEVMLVQDLEDAGLQAQTTAKDRQEELRPPNCSVDFNQYTYRSKKQPMVRGDSLR